MESSLENPGSAGTKTCPVCAETIKEAALKCRFCNADLQEFSDAQSDSVEKLLFKGRPVVIFSVWQWIAVVFTLGLGYVYYWIKSLAMRYEITTQRIRVERGLLSTVKDSVELFTIEHFDIQKPLGMRFVGHAILQLRSSDSSYPSLSIYGIDHLEVLGDRLRECSLRERKRRQVMSIIRP